MKTLRHYFDRAVTLGLAALLLPLYLAFLICVHSYELYLRIRYGEQYEDGGDV